MTSNSSEVPEPQKWYQDEETELWDLCPVCDGLGCDNWDDDDVCWRCYGEGMIRRA